jgi:hypothetical protein
MPQSNSSLIKETTQKLNEINKTISKLDPAIRLEAYNRLAPMYFGDGQSHPDKNDKNNAGIQISSEDKEKFFEELEDDPTENVKHIVAWFYSQYGSIPISVQMIEEEANNLGRTIPNRSDNTMRQGKDQKKNGKSLFRKNGKGWQLTVPGEMFVKKTYGVKKGNKPLPVEEPK